MLRKRRRRTSSAPPADHPTDGAALFHDFRDFRRGSRGAFWGVAGLLLIGGVVSSARLVQRHESRQSDAATVKQGPVSIKVIESGELHPRDQVTISAVNEKQIRWLAPEGTQVKAGDTLVVFESTKYVISTSEAQSSLQVEQANLVRAQNDLEAQKAKEESARTHYESLLPLAEKGFVQESEIEGARLAYVELKSQTKSLGAGVTAARANVERASRAVDQEERKLAEGVKTAPRAGLVVYASTGTEGEAKKISVGMTPFAGMDLMYLPDVSSMLVTIQISEVDVARTRVGLPATIRIDAYPGVTFPGVVQSIGNLAKRRISRVTGKETGARVFDVAIQVQASDPRLKPGLTATVEITTNEYHDVLYVPIEAVFFDEREEPVVYVKHGDAIQTRVVELGESNDRVTIVTKNLRAGEQLLLTRPNAL